LEKKHNKLRKDNKELTNKVLSLEDTIQDLDQEKKELQRQINYSEKKKKTESSNSPSKVTSLEEEIQRNNEKEFIKNLITENENYKNELAKLKIHLENHNTSLSTIKKLEQEKDRLIQQLDKERAERQRLEQEKEQTDLISSNSTKEIEILQRRLAEKVDLINSLNQQLHRNQADWQQKAPSINEQLRQAQEKLANLIGEQKETNKTLQIRTQE